MSDGDMVTAREGSKWSVRWSDTYGGGYACYSEFDTEAEAEAWINGYPPGCKGEHVSTADFARVLLDHLDECPVCGCPRITFGVPCEGVCECECHDERIHCGEDGQ
jgi:hypothetical protein